VDCRWNDNDSDAGNAETAKQGQRATPPTTAASHCSQGVWGVLQAWEMTRAGNDERRHGNERLTTRPQPHEQLLMGWIAGGTKTTPTYDVTDDTPPASSPTSHCSWGGSQVEQGQR
jgi:hypothetical protein